jgi:hypothetical protein
LAKTLAFTKTKKILLFIVTEKERYSAYIISPTSKPLPTPHGFMLSATILSLLKFIKQYAFTEYSFTFVPVLGPPESYFALSSPQLFR